MDAKFKNSEIPEKILSQNLLLIQDLNKEIENDFNTKLSKNIPQKVLLQTIFKLLNSQISLIFQLSKINICKSPQKSNNFNLLSHIISFNKELLSKQIKKIISLIKISNKKIKKSINNKNNDLNNKLSKKFKKELNNSFLINSSFKINKKNKLSSKNKTFLIDTELTQEYGNCITHTSKNIEKNKNYIFNSYVRYTTNQNMSSKKKMKKYDSYGIGNLNPKLINYVRNKSNFINKNNNNDKNLNLLKKGMYLTPINRGVKIEFNYKDINNDEENPVRKVKKIIINAKRNNSMSRDKIRRKESNEINDSNNYEIRIKKCQERNNKKLHNLNSSETDFFEHKNIYNNFSESIREIQISPNNSNVSNIDKNSNYYINMSKGDKKDREINELLHDGMKNIKNRLIYNKLHKKE